MELCKPRWFEVEKKWGGGSDNVVKCVAPLQNGLKGGVRQKILAALLLQRPGKKWAEGTYASVIEGWRPLAVMHQISTKDKS